ncbi:MAG TPA: hypothetical protein VGR87_04595 [Candidatus Limnocylindria bacterium]|nr:hypothetical protein [Candidatus Limnocylindria bacterium]
MSCGPFSPVASSALPTATPGETANVPRCSGARLRFLVEQLFARYEARDLDGFLALFNWSAPAAGGGFGSYHDDPGEQHQLSDRASLADHVRGRLAIDDRFAVAAVGDYPDRLTYPNANPTVAFTRSFANVTQAGNAKLVCNAGLLVRVVMSSR